MNAIVSLCHFCEAHGPGSIFTTQTLRDIDIDEQLIPHLTQQLQQQQQQQQPQPQQRHHSSANDKNARSTCAACQSSDPGVCMLSNDDDSNAHFISGQQPVSITGQPDALARLIKAASTRSLSCEVSADAAIATAGSATGDSSSTNNDIQCTANDDGGGFVFFGDADSGYVLSHTFHIRDARARGLHRLFSIVCLMRDKSYLLNIQPWLAASVRRIAKRLQDYAFATYTAEQSAAGQSERSRRLQAGTMGAQAPRSLAELTGEAHIFAQLHTHFAWLLWAGARCLRENVALGCGKQQQQQQPHADGDGPSMVRINMAEWFLPQRNSRWQNDAAGADDATAANGCAASERRVITMRDANAMLAADFAAICYCAMVGVQIVLRGPPTATGALMRCVQRLLPQRMHGGRQFARSDSPKYVPPGECRLLAVAPTVAVPQPQPHIFRVDFVGDMANNEVCVVRWPGRLPDKLPDLFLKTMKAVNERLFDEHVLNKHISLLVEEWNNKISCLAKITSHHEMIKMKQILGIKSQDQMIVEYWSH